MKDIEKKSIGENIFRVYEIESKDQIRYFTIIIYEVTKIIITKQGVEYCVDSIFFDKNIDALPESLHENEIQSYPYFHNLQSAKHAAKGMTDQLCKAAKEKIQKISIPKS